MAIRCLSQVPESEGVLREKRRRREETTYLRTRRQAKIKNTRAFTIMAGCGPPPLPTTRLRAGRSFMSWVVPEPRVVSRVLMDGHVGQGPAQMNAGM